MGKIDGIVTLEELPEKEIYVEVESKFISEIKKKIRKSLNTQKFRKWYKLKKRIISHWFNDGSLLRLDVFKSIVNFFQIDLKKIRILSLRGKGGEKIKNPKLPFNFTTTSGVRVIAAILGDGSLNKKGLTYVNSNPYLIKSFVMDMKKVFGEINVAIKPKRKGSKVLVAFPPKICGKIINLVGIPIGSKVSNNPHVPPFIFKLSGEKIQEFISQIIDDEGSVSIASRHIRIKFSTLKEETCNLIKDIYVLLKRIGIASSIYEGDVYKSKRGGDRKNWCIEIHSFAQLERIYHSFNLRNEKRRKDLKKLLEKKKVDQFPKKKCKEIYLSLMKNIQQEKGYFTSSDLAEITGRTIGSCRNTILKFKKLNLIKSVQPSFTGKPPSPARYVVIK